MNEPIFTVGQKVIATCNYMHQLTEGKQYTVIDYIPSARDSNAAFTWPAYVTVIGDSGKPVTGHTYRFKPVEG